MCIFGACPVSYGFQAPAAIDTEVVRDASGALPDAPEASRRATIKQLPLNILKDQIPLWTSPVRIRPHDLLWLLPLGATTGITLATDTDAMRDLPHDRSFNKNSVNASNYLLGGEVSVPVMLFGVSLFNNNAHAHEAGILSGEALADAAVVEEVSKIILRRERPLYNNAFSSAGASSGTAAGIAGPPEQLAKTASCPRIQSLSHALNPPHVSARNCSVAAAVRKASSLQLI